MNAIDKATPRPWVFKVVPNSIGRCFKIGSEAQVNDAHGSICLYDDSTSFNPRSHEQAEADAFLIVKAVNEYEALNVVAEAAMQEHGKKGLNYNLECPICRAVEILATIRAKEVA